MMNKKLDSKVNEITQTYKQLQKAEYYIVKKTLIGSLRKLCLQGLEIFDQEKVTPQTIRKKKQIEDMLKKCTQIESKLDTSQNVNPSIGCGSRTIRMGMVPSQQQLCNMHNPQHLDGSLIHQKSRQVARSIIFHQMTSQNMKISPQELDQLALRFEKNNQVMKQIHMMVMQQGGDIDKLQQEIKLTYQNVQNANTELQQAAEQQHKNRILKIRLGVSGFLGVIGLKILGLPGLIFGFFSGMTVTK